MSTPARVRFAGEGTYHKTLKERVDAYFAETGLSPRDLPRMYLKSAVILMWFGASWAYLVFAATTIWQGLLGAVALGIGQAMIGMNVMHDANHGGFSSRPWVNRIFGFCLDMVGGSSALWKQKHNVLHHTYTNLHELDNDINQGFIARMSPDATYRTWHRYQHLYIWFLYCFLTVKWIYIDDFRVILERKIGKNTIPALSARELFWLFLGKAIFFVLVLVVPLQYHSLPVVLCFQMVMFATSGLTLATIFQLAHCLEEADFPEIPAERKIASEWAAHQTETTVDFATTSPFWTFFTGGLNFQTEHHIFPKVCHLHYPALAKIVAQTAAEHGIQYRAHPTFFSALRSHYRWLKRLGQPEEVVRGVVQEAA